MKLFALNWFEIDWKPEWSEVAECHSEANETKQWHFRLYCRDICGQANRLEKSIDYVDCCCCCYFFSSTARCAYYCRMIENVSMACDGRIKCQTHDIYDNSNTQYVFGPNTRRTVAQSCHIIETWIHHEDDGMRRVRPVWPEVNFISLRAATHERMDMCADVPCLHLCIAFRSQRTRRHDKVTFYYDGVVAHREFVLELVGWRGRGWELCLRKCHQRH